MQRHMRLCLVQLEPWHTGIEVLAKAIRHYLAHVLTRLLVAIQTYRTEDGEGAQVVYAAEQGDYGKLMGNIASYKVPLIDMFLFVCEQADAGIIQLDAEQMSMLSAAARSSQCCSCCSFCRRFCCSAADWRIRPASPYPPPRGRTSRASVCLSSAL